MKRFIFHPLGLACLVLLLGAAGCQTEGGNNLKERGVYTTLAIDEPGLDMASSEYLQKNSFGPGENPAAVVVGFGNYNQQQSISLQVVELNSGRVLLSQDHQASYGKALVLPLPIRLGGDYQVRLLLNGTEFDSCQFTVARTNQPGAAPAGNAPPGAKYAEGFFAVSVEAANDSGLFSQYDDGLIYAALNSVTKTSGTANHLLFAQRFPGKVVIQCHQDFHGRITEPRILENTIDHECGAVLQKAVLARSPYAPWPEELHRKLGSDFRDLKLTIRYD